jgi:hypothetical protein
MDGFQIGRRKLDPLSLNWSLAQTEESIWSMVFLMEKRIFRQRKALEGKIPFRGRDIW